MDINLTIDIAEDCGCCGGATPKKCFQLWTADFDCETELWTLTPGAKVCLPSATSTGWTGSACSWQRYVNMDDTECTVNGDCTGLDNTAEPPPPFGGEPPSCCPCTGDCGCFSVGKTAVVSFAGVLNAMPCTECVRGAGLSTFYRAKTGALGTYTLPGDGVFCAFEKITTGVVIEFADGPTGGGCPPDGDFTPIDYIDIVLSFDGVTTWTLTVHGEEFFSFFNGTAEQGDCDGPLVFTNTNLAYDGCPGTTEIVNINGTATVTFIPCVPV